jgi:hypothetical protein
MQSPYRPDGSSSSSEPPNLDGYTKEQLYSFIRSAEQRAGQTEQQLHQLQQQQFTAQITAAAAAVAPAVLVAEPPAGLAQQLAQALASAAPLTLPLFNGAGNASGLAAHSWLQQVERAFEERVLVAGPLGDGRRIHAAGVALRGGADIWYSSLAQRPTTWAGFRSALLARFQPAGALLLIEAQLDALSAAAAKMSSRLNTQGLTRYTTEFQQLANQIPAGVMLERTKIMIYRKGLPMRLQEIILLEDEKANQSGQPMELNKIADRLLQRAATRESASGASGGSSHHSSDAMDISALDLCCQTFGVSAVDAAQYLEPSEGWASHETSGQRAAPASSSSGHQLGVHALSQAASEQRIHALEMQLAALGRRSVAPPVKRDVPDQLAAERKTAGLCIRCGVAKYEAGGKGHNSRTCQAPVDKTTGVAVGAKKAGIGAPLFQ